MMRNSERIIQLTNNWLLEIDKLPVWVKAYWTKIATIIFEQDLSKEQITLLSSQGKTKMVKEDINSETKLMSTAVLKLLQLEAERRIELEISREISGLRDNKLMESGIDVSESEKLAEKLAGKLEEWNKRKIIRIPATVRPLVIEHLFRWLLLFFLYPEWSEEIWLINILLVSAPAVGLFYWRHKYIKRRNKYLIQTFANQKQYRIKVVLSAFQWSVLAILWALSAFVALVLLSETNSLYTPFLVAVAIGLALYYAVYIANWGQAELKEKELVPQFEETEYSAEELSAELNDEIIVKQGVELKSIIGKLETYVLESALFGALAFSGFLQIMAENLVGFEDLENFGNHLFQLFRSIVLFDPDLLREILVLLSSKKDLFSLISLETLLCSAFFLIVIASRLRFTDRADQMEQHLALATAYNNKEEGMLAGSSEKQDLDKLEMYNNIIAVQLVKGNKVLREIVPILTYMRYFRNAGIFIFFIVLISSALFISSIISWFIAVVALISYVYFNLKELRNLAEHLGYQIRSLFVRRGRIFLWSSVALFVLAFILRTRFQIEKTDLMLFWGVVLFGLYLFTWIVFIPHYDPLFKSKEESDLSTGNWLSVRIVWGISLLLGTVGYSMKLLNWSGAGLALGIGVFMLTVVLFFVASYMSSEKMMARGLALAVSTMTLGILFKVMHLPSAFSLIGIGVLLMIAIVLYINFKLIQNKKLALLRSLGPILFFAATFFKIGHIAGAGLMLYFALFSMGITILSFVKWPQKIRYFHKTYVINVVVLIALSGGLVLGSSGSGELAYDNYTTDRKVLNRVMDIRMATDRFADDIQQGIYWEKKLLEEYFGEIEWYLGYTHDLPFTEDESRILEIYGELTLEIYSEGTEVGFEKLKIGLELSKVVNKIGRKIQYNPNYFQVHEGEVSDLRELEKAFRSRLSK